MSVSHEILMAAPMASVPLKVIGAAPAAIVAGGTIAKAFSIVHQGEMGIRTYKGIPVLQRDVAKTIGKQLTQHTKVSPDRLTKREKAEVRAELIRDLDEERVAKGIYKIVGPGFYAIHPIYGNIAKIPVIDKTIPIEDDFPLESSDGQQLLLKPAFTWFVRSDCDNPYNARFKIDNDRHKSNKDAERNKELEQTVAWICIQGLGIALRDRTANSLINYDPVEVTKTTREACLPDLLEYGVDLKDVRLKPIARTPEERIAQAIERTHDPAGAAIGVAAILGREKDQNVVQLSPPGPNAA